MISHFELYHTQNHIRKINIRKSNLYVHRMPVSLVRFLLSLLSSFPFIFCVVSICCARGHGVNDFGIHLLEYEYSFSWPNLNHVARQSAMQ